MSEIKKTNECDGCGAPLHGRKCSYCKRTYEFYERPWGAPSYGNVMLNSSYCVTTCSPMGYLTAERGL